jgi:hypothetical protein
MVLGRRDLFDMTEDVPMSDFDAASLFDEEEFANLLGDDGEALEYELEDEADLAGEEPDLFEEAADMQDALRGALLEEFADVTPEQMDEALFNMLESLTPAESFNVGKALSQVGKGFTGALSDPTIGRIAQTALPIAGGAAGTLIGGPAGTAIGSGLGAAAAKALPMSKTASSSPAMRTPIPPAVSTAPPAVSIAEPAAPTAPPAVSIAPSVVPTAPPAPTPVAGGSAAAAQGLVLTQQPEVLKSLLALALGEHGRKTVNGVSVGSVMNLLSSIFGRAAADADELARSMDLPSYLLDEEGNLTADPAAPSARADALYAVLLDAENDLLEEALAWP